MKVVIAGGTGMIGKALSLALLEDQHRVTILSRRPEKHLTSFPEGIQLVGWDPCGDGWQHHLEDARAVVNLAGAGIASGRWTQARKRAILDSRISSVNALITAMLQMDLRPVRYLQASAVGYYGAHANDIIEEQQAPGDDFLARVTAAWESASDPLEKEGVRRILLRTGLVLARRGGALPRLALPFHFLLGGRLGSGKQYMPWIHLEDEVRAIQHLLLQPQAAGPYNLSAPEPVTNGEFARVLGRAMRRPAWLPLPPWVLRVLLGELAGTLLTGQRAVPTRLLSEGFRFKYTHLQDALEAIYT